MKYPNFEATFRRILGAFEIRVRQDQSELRHEYQKVGEHEVEVKREKVVLMFRHHQEVIKNLRAALIKIETETMDPPIQEVARKALKLR